MQKYQSKRRQWQNWPWNLVAHESWWSTESDPKGIRTTRLRWFQVSCKEWRWRRFCMPDGKRNSQSGQNSPILQDKPCALHTLNTFLTNHSTHHHSAATFSLNGHLLRFFSHCSRCFFFPKASYHDPCLSNATPFYRNNMIYISSILHVLHL